MPFLNKLLIFLFIPEMTPEEEDAVIGYLYRSRSLKYFVLFLLMAVPWTNIRNEYFLILY